MSTGVGFAGVEALSADCAAGWAELEPLAAAGVALSPVAPGLEELEGLEPAAADEVFSAGGFAVPDPFSPASTVPLVDGGAMTGLVPLAPGAGVAVAGCSDVGWPLSSSGVRISAPTPVWFVFDPTGAVVASSGVTTSELVDEVCVLAPAALPVSVNDGPAAPGRSTSVADTASFGGAICGIPPRAALDVSGFPLSIPSGSFTTMLW